MGTFGEELAKEREYRGISLFKITEATKISSRHLEALEQNRFDQLPGGVFNKGIVRGYARVCGLDEEAWVERYMAAYAVSGMLKDDDADWVKFAQNVVQTRPRDAVRPDMRLRWAGVGVLLVLLVGLAWFVWQYVDHRISALNRPPAAVTVLLTRATPSVSRSLRPAPSGSVDLPLG
ncbi:MAG TPA: helix-turn-helix transcriptional regulator [Acidisarcina sp.]